MQRNARAVYHNPVEDTKQDVFEQIVRYMLSSDYAAAKESVVQLLRSAIESIVTVDTDRRRPRYT